MKPFVSFLDVIMNNHDLYQKDPATRKLVNEGVVSVNDLHRTLAEKPAARAVKGEAS